jgi:isopenicillin N synthase-like dioxygenase
MFKATILKIAAHIALLSSSIYASDLFHSSIPVIDMNLYESPSTKEEFIQKFADALHDIGFCAIVNTGMDHQVLNEAYDMSIQFFKSSLEKKLEIHDPKVNGQRGFIFSENAQGFKATDLKEFIHIGYESNLWPSWINIQTPFENLLQHLDIHSQKLQTALSLFMGQDENFLFEMTKKGDSVLRALYYPQTSIKDRIWAAEHTDIDLFTILPMATEEGLQVLYNGQWLDVQVPENCFIINCGDMLENMSNGYFKSSVHRVISKGNNKERFSIVYFVHPRDEDQLDPLSYCVEMTGGVARFPTANRLEMLAHRLVEIGMASEELKHYDARSGYMDRIADLVNNENAAPAVTKTYNIWKSSQR